MAERRKKREDGVGFCEAWGCVARWSTKSMIEMVQHKRKLEDNERVE